MERTDYKNIMLQFIKNAKRLHCTETNIYTVDREPVPEYCPGINDSEIKSHPGHYPKSFTIDRGPDSNAPNTVKKCSKV